MKQIKKHIHLLTLFFLLVSTVACEDFAFGDKFLQKPPSGDVTIDTIFSTAENARQVLYYCYSTLPYGFPSGWNLRTGMWVGVLEDLTDLGQSCVGYGGPEEHYYSGSYNAGTEDQSGAAGATKYNMNYRNSWIGIRHAWVIINHIDRVPDMTEDEKERLKAEAKLIIAIHYAEMFRHFGGLPIVDRVIMPDDLELPVRSTVEETVNFIVKLLDEAANCEALPWALPESDLNNWGGRLTRAAAMGLKARVLLFAASPLFNNDTPYFEGEASSQLLTWYGNYSQERWAAAAQACKEFFDTMNREGYYGLVKDNSNYRMGFRAGYRERNTTESLISVRLYRRTNGVSALMQSMRWGGWCPTKESFDMFPMANGEDFDWNNPEHARNPFINRDPRLGETILLDGDEFRGTQAQVYQAKPGDEKNYPKGSHVGANSLDSHSLDTGIAVRKFAGDRTSEWTNFPIQWPYLRLAEVYLTYAEALNECGRTNEAYPYINAVRNRVGIGNLQLKGEQDEQTEFREAVLRERACEFAWEEVRFFDLIRWKREADFTKPLHGLTIYRNINTGEYEFEFPQLAVRAWQRPGGFSPKWYLSAFPSNEVNKGYGIIQNPGW